MNQPPIKRRRFSFSLRTLMVFMLALCLLFGFIGMRLQRAREQQAILRELRETGCTYCDSAGNDVEPAFWELVIDSNYLDRIEIASYFINAFFANDVENRLDVTTLLELKNLKNLYLSYTQASDLSPLANLNNLEWLSLSGTQVNDLSPLASLKKLVHLDINGTQVSDLSPLAELKNIEGLSLNHTQVSDLSPLADLKNLHVLSLIGTHVSDLSPLANLKNLNQLDIKYTQVNDLSPLADLKNLNSLFIRITRASEEEIRKLKKSLPNLIVERGEEGNGDVAVPFPP